MMKTIFVFLAEGFEEFEALAPVDVLRRAGLSVQTVSVMDEQVVAGAHGVPVVADKMFAEINPEDAEMILLPGGMPGATNLDAHEGLSKMILEFAKAKKDFAFANSKNAFTFRRKLLQLFEMFLQLLKILLQALLPINIWCLFLISVVLL